MIDSALRLSILVDIMLLRLTAMPLRLNAVLFLAAASVFAAGNQDIFDKQIQPVLAKNCASCHAGATPASGLNLSALESALAGGKHGAAITPGDAAHSLLIQQIKGEKAPKMPLGGSLPEATIAELAAAINQMQPLPKSAAKTNAYTDWLLHKPVKPAPPSVKDAQWVANPIDAFVLQKLEAAGLQPAPAADQPHPDSSRVPVWWVFRPRPMK